VIAHAPVAQAVASPTRFAEQITGFSPNEFPYSDGMRGQIDEALDPELSRAIGSTRFFKATFPLHVPDIVSRSVTVASAGLLVLRALSACTVAERRTRGQDAQEQARAFCGCLSSSCCWRWRAMPRRRDYCQPPITGTRPGSTGFCRW
jgi:hypothetical protein